MDVKISQLPEYIGIPQPVGDIPISINGVTYRIKPELLSNSLLNLDTVLANGNTSGRNINILGVMGDLTSTNILSDTGTSATVLDPTIGNLNYYGNFNAYGASLQTKIFDQNGQATSTLIAGMFTSGFSLSRLQNGFNNLSSLRLNNSDDPFLEFGKVGGNYTTLKATWGGSNINQTFLLPNKGSGTYTLATLNDISGGGGGVGTIQQVLDNGNTSNTGIIINSQNETGVLINLSAESTGFVVSTVAGDELSFPILLNNDQLIYFQIDNGGNLTTSGFLEAQTIKKTDGLPTQFLMADGSVSSGGTPPINAFSILANNTNASEIPTSKVYKEVAEQTLSGTGMTATGGTLPTGTQTHSYRWSQIGNLVTLRINLQFATAGTCSGIAIPFANMSDIPQTPQHPSIFATNGDVIIYGSGSLSNTKAFPTFTVGNGTSAIRKSPTANTYEILVGRASGSYANAWVHIQYYI